jgi:hypothetical protein
MQIKAINKTNGKTILAKLRERAKVRLKPKYQPTDKDKVA